MDFRFCIRELIPTQCWILKKSRSASLILFSEEAEMGGNPWYGLLVIVGCICYAINSNTIAKYLRDMKALIISAASFSIVGVPAFLYIFNFLQIGVF